MALRVENTNQINVSNHALAMVLDAFRYGQSFMQTEIAMLEDISDMTVSRAARRLRRMGVLDVREEVDADGVNKRHTVYPRDISSLLVIDISGNVFRTALLDTSLNILMNSEHIYNPIFDFEDNLRMLLNGACKSGLVDEWRNREVIHSLPYNPERKERMRRSRAKRIARLVAKMKTCFRPLARLGIIMPNEYTFSSLGVCPLDEERIRQTVDEFFEFRTDACLSPGEAFLTGAPSVIASGASAVALANARSALIFGSGGLFGNKSFSVYLCRDGARSPWALPDGAAKEIAFAPLRNDVPLKRNVMRITEYFTPDIIAYEKDFRVKADICAIETQCRAIILGAGIILRESAWREYVRFAE